MEFLASGVSILRPASRRVRGAGNLLASPPAEPFAAQATRQWLQGRNPSKSLKIERHPIFYPSITRAVCGALSDRAGGRS